MMQLHPWSHPTSAGLTLRGWHSEPSAKPVLHFLHGNGLCSRAYEPMLTPLAADFDLWLCDAQGHGESDQGGRFLGWKQNAMLAAEAISAGREIFGNAPLHAVGHSFGSVLTTFMLAAQPALFQRAVLLDPVLFTPAMIGVMALSDFFGLSNINDLAKRARRRRQRWPDRAAAYSDFHGRGVFRGWHDDALRAYVDHALKDVDEGVELKCQPAQEAAIFASYPQGLWSALRRIRTPTLALHGERSFPFVHKSVHRWCQLNHYASAHRVPGGHCFMQEHPADSARRIAQFLLR
jgi:pimeloyl-ACP methyl ester carboxylesterase